MKHISNTLVSEILLVAGSKISLLFSLRISTTVQWLDEWVKLLIVVCDLLDLISCNLMYHSFYRGLQSYSLPPYIGHIRLSWVNNHRCVLLQYFLGNKLNKSNNISSSSKFTSIFLYHQ